jgi:hypothetical protein
MTRFLSLFSRTAQALPTSVRRRPVQPSLERLGDRLVPASNGWTSAISIYHALGRYSFTERDWFTVDQATGQVVEFSGTIRHNLGGPSNVGNVSASVDPATGFGEVFAITNGWNGPLWLCDSSGSWHNFGGTYTAISATRDGHVFARASWTDVEYIDSNGKSTSLGGPPGGITSYFAASVDGVGRNEVFGIAGNGAI